VEIADKAFYDNRSITSVVIPEGVTTIGENAFAFCLSLHTVVLPESLRTISYGAFMMCQDLKSINLPSGLTEIGADAFSACISLKKIIIPNGIAEENFYVFYMYLNSLKKYEIDGEHSNLYTIDGNLYGEFQGQTMLLSYAMGNDETKFTTPEGVDAIYTGAFSFYPFDYEKTENESGLIWVDYYSNLKNVVISEGVKDIYSGAFIYLNSMRSIHLPSTLEYIGPSAFIECRGITYVKFNGTIAEWEAIEKSETWFVDSTITVIHCTDGDANPIASTNKEPITVWVPNDSSVFEEQINKFMASHPEYSNYEIIIETIDTNEVASDIINNSSAAPDIFYFPSYDLDKLVEAGALVAPNLNTESILKNRNSNLSGDIASYLGKMYAYPLSESNGYYMYYDKSIITNPESLEQIIADVEAYNKANGENKKICFNVTNAWYISAFFFATGCHSNWIVEASNGSIGIDDNFNSENGLIALKGVNKLTQSSCFADFESMDNAAVMITGIWNETTALDVFGTNLAATDLPSFVVDESEYHLGSYSNGILLGVKPQTDKDKIVFLNELALYLSNKECQLELYNEFGWIPSNRIAQQDESIISNPSIAALIKQSQYSTPQRAIPDDWWSIMAILGDVAKNNTTDETFREALEEYETHINGIVTK
jgi:arabinogalactan oligomer/maltooligosaccharide transport system substrate-binding protein